MKNNPGGEKTPPHLFVHGKRSLNTIIYEIRMYFIYIFFQILLRSYRQIFIKSSKRLHLKEGYLSVSVELLIMNCMNYF